MKRNNKHFVKMFCKECNQVTVMEYEPTTADEHNRVQMGCNDTLKDVSPKSGGTPHHIITEALKRLKDTMGFGIPDKET